MVTHVATALRRTHQSFGIINASSRYRSSHALRVPRHEAEPRKREGVTVGNTRKTRVIRAAGIAADRDRWTLKSERANVNVSPDVPSPIFFFPSHEHSLACGSNTPVTCVCMPVADRAIRPFKIALSSGQLEHEDFLSRVRVPF